MVITVHVAQDLLMFIKLGVGNCKHTSVIT